MDAKKSLKHSRDLIISNVSKDLKHINDSLKSEPILITNPYAKFDYESIFGRLTKKQCLEICQDIRRTPKVLPNDPCPCGSGRKYKKCCKRKE